MRAPKHNTNGTFSIVPDALKKDRRLNGWDLRTFLALAQLTHKKRPKWIATVSARRIAENMGAVTESDLVMVRRALRHLEECGHIRATVRKGAISSYDLTPAWGGTQN